MAVMNAVPQLARIAGAGETRIAAMDAAYELYVSRLGVLNRLCGERNGDPEQARQLAQVRLLAEEAYARWFMLARPDQGQRPGNDNHRR
jgi:hypothetical protein